MARWKKSDSMPFSPWVPTISLRTHSSPFHCHQRTKVTAVPTKKSPLFIFSQQIKVCRGDDKSCYSENSRRMPDRWSVNKNIKKKICSKWLFTCLYVKCYIMGAADRAKQRQSPAKESTLGWWQGLISVETQVMIEIPHSPASQCLHPMNLR